jgi:hypothetical protein
MSWMQKIRLKALGFAIGLTLAAVGAISWMALPALPVIGVAFATAAVVLNSMTSRITGKACQGCGTSLKGQAQGDHGTVCPGCGLVNQFSPWDRGPLS